MDEFTARAQLLLVVTGGTRRSTVVSPAPVPEEQRGVYCAVSELPNDAGWSARIVAHDGLLLRDAIAAWQRLFEGVR